MIITFLISKYQFQVYLLFTSFSGTFSAGRSRRFTFFKQSGKYSFLNRMHLRMTEVFTGTRAPRKAMSHIFFLGNYLLRMYAIHAQYNWMFPLRMLFFHIISIYVYGLMPARNKGMHAFPVAARFLFT